MYAAVTDISPNLKVRFPGDPDGDGGKTTIPLKLSGYSPTVGDKVAVVQLGRTMLCLGAYEAA